MYLLTLAAERECRVLNSFLEILEKNGRNGVRIYYFCDYGRCLLDNRKDWHVLWRGKVTSPPWTDLPATIYEYTAEVDSVTVDRCFGNMMWKGVSHV